MEQRRSLNPRPIAPAKVFCEASRRSHWLNTGAPGPNARVQSRSRRTTRDLHIRRWAQEFWTRDFRPIFEGFSPSSKVSTPSSKARTLLSRSRAGACGKTCQLGSIARPIAFRNSSADFSVWVGCTSHFGETEPSRIGKPFVFRHQGECKLGACASLKSRLPPVAPFMRSPRPYSTAQSPRKRSTRAGRLRRCPELLTRSFQGIFEDLRASSNAPGHLRSRLP
jgi:hypothetical protein